MFTPTSGVAFRKGGILRHIAALTLEQMCCLSHLKKGLVICLTLSELGGKSDIICPMVV